MRRFQACLWVACLGTLLAGCAKRPDTAPSEPLRTPEAAEPAQQQGPAGGQGAPAHRPDAPIPKGAAEGESASEGDADDADRPFADPPSSESPPPPEPERDTAGDLLSTWWDDFEAAELAVQRATDCNTSCRALTSMTAAAERICSIAGEGARCTRARQRLDRARRKVTASCGACGD